jgi:hypothetical protein
MERVLRFERGIYQQGERAVVINGVRSFTRDLEAYLKILLLPPTMWGVACSLIGGASQRNITKLVLCAEGALKCR